MESITSSPSFLQELVLKRTANATNCFILETSDFKRIHQLVRFVMDFGQEIFKGAGEEGKERPLEKFLLYNIQTQDVYDLHTKALVMDGQFGVIDLKELIKVLTANVTVLLIKYVFSEDQARALSNFLVEVSQNEKIYRNRSTVVVFTACAEFFPEAVRKLCHTIEIVPSLPEERKNVLEAVKNEILKAIAKKYGKEKEIPLTINDDIITATAGLDLHEIETAALESYTLHKNFVVQTFTSYKIRLLKEAGVEFIQPTRGFESIGGYDYLKQYMRSRIITILRKPEIAKYYGLSIPKGILLFGPPGTGKTWFAKALAKEVGLPMIYVDPSTFLRGIVGETEARVKKVTLLIESLAPCIVFIDEFDQLTLSRSAVMSTDSGVTRRMTNMLLAWLGDENRKSFIVGATNFVTDIDPAFLRPGRLDEALPVFYPDKKAREEILRVHTSVIRKVPLASDVDLSVIAARTEWFTGAELEKIVIEAAMLAMLESADKVEMEHFNKAINAIDINIADRERKLRGMITDLKKVENVNKSLLTMAMKEIQKTEEETRVTGVI